MEDAVEKIRRDRFVGLAKWSAALAAAWYQQRVRRVDFDPAETADDIVSERLRFLEAWEQDAFRRVLKTNLEGLKAGRVPVSTVPPPPSHDLADPVEHARGEFVHEATDLVVRGAGVDFAFHRTYRHQTAFDGPLGSRWDHGYNLFLLIDEENATLATGGGRLERYRRHASWGQAAGCDYYVPPDGVDATLEPIGVHDAPGGWARRGPDGLRHVFEPEPHWSGGFRLARIEDRWGNNLRLTYVDRPNGQVRLGRVYVNHDARWVQFSYDELDRIVRLEDHTGRAWRYRYDTHGDLIGVTTPATPDQPRGATTEYRYSSAERTGPLAHLLTDIFDAEGRHYLHTTYGVDQGQPDYNRVIQQRVGTGDYQFRYQPVESPDLGLAAQDRPTMQCWVKERNGFQTLYVYNEWGSLLWKQETDKGPGHAPRQVVWRYRYNRDGALIASRTPEGVVRHVLTGRDHFLCAYGVATADPSAEALWQRAALTADERRGFGRVLATVERAAPHVAVSFGWADRWGDVYAVEPGDLVVKYTYEQAYGQPLTTSDPRTTTASDPRVPEPPAYHRLLTRFEYSAAPKHALVRVVRPTPTLPTLPNGTLGADVVSEILERDPRGRVTQLRDPLGVESTTEYLGEAEGARAGFGWRTTIDPGDRALGKLALTTEHEVDELGRVTATTLPRGVDSADRRFVVRTKYDALDRVVKAWAATPLATETRTRYEAAGKPARIEINWIGPGGEHHGVIVQRFAYDEEHRLRQEWQGGEDPTGHRRATHRYNAAGQKTVTIAANDTATIWKYDSRDLLARTIRGPGVDESIEVVVRDRDGRVIEQRSAEGRVTLITYDAFGRAVATTDGLGHVTRVSYDRGGRPTVVRRFERVADGAGNVRFQLLARSEAIYDELGRACREVHSRFDVPPPLVTEAALARAYEDGVGVPVESQSFFDAAGRLVRAVDPLGHATETVYDAAGRVVRVTGPTRNRLETAYDAHGNVVRVDRVDVVRDQTGAEVGQQVFTSFATYDERDRRLTDTDALGNVTRHAYDSLDREVETEDPLGNVTEHVYDVYGDLVEVRSRRTTTGDRSGTELSPHVVRHEHDRAGLVTARIDALRRRTEYRHDKQNRLVEQIFPDGARLVTRYDRDSLVSAVRDAHGVVIRSQYDELGRLRTTVVDAAEVDAGVLIEGTLQLDRTYDALGRERTASNETCSIAVAYDSLDRAVAEDTTIASTGRSLHLSRTFDAAGRLTGITYPGGRTLAYPRDAAGRLLAVEHTADGVGYPGPAGGPRRIAAYAYAGDRPWTVAYANGTAATYAFDARGGAIELNHTGPGGTIILRVQQLRDGARAPRARFEELGTAARAERFGYDSRYQLGVRTDAAATPFDLGPFAPATSPPVVSPPPRQPLLDAAIGPRLSPEAPTGTDGWSYDLTGNRARTTSEATTVDYEPADVRDRYPQVGSTAFTYDRAGNLTSDGTHDYIYDGFRRLVRIVLRASGADVARDVARYAYDPAGRRVIEDRPGAAPLVLAYDGPDRIADHRDGACVAQYVHGPLVDDPVELATGGAHHIYHLDLQGSVRALSSSAGATAATYRFDPFGVTVDANGPALGPPTAGVPTGQPFGYAARPLEPATGHYDARARVYVPALGRFLQRDPAGPVDGHLYAYAGNAPLAFGDPSGLARKEHHAAGADDAALDQLRDLGHGIREALTVRRPYEIPPVPDEFPGSGDPFVRGADWLKRVDSWYERPQGSGSLVGNFLMGLTSPGTKRRLMRETSRQDMQQAAASQDGPAYFAASDRYLAAQVNRGYGPIVETITSVATLADLVPGAGAALAGRRVTGVIATARRGALTSASVGPAFDATKLARIQVNLEKRGVAFVTGEEGGRLASALGGEAVYIPEVGRPGIVAWGPNPSRAAVVEELLHLGQHRVSGWADIGGRVVELEIQAQRQLLRVGVRLGWSEPELAQIDRALASWMGVR